MKTTISKTDRGAARWWVVDASKETLGRMATRVAQILQGKHKPTWTPHADTGDFVVVINAKDVQVTGKKAQDKVWYDHTRYPSGLKARKYPELREKHPDEIVRRTVRRMMPKTTLGRHMLRKLKIYGGTEHPHHAQNPEPLAFGTGK
jgi:large subunit ribosomal protein L13